MRVSLLGVALAALLIGASAQARPPGPPPPHRILLDQADVLGITAAESTAIEAAAEDLRDVAREAHDALRAAKQSEDAEAIAGARQALDAVRDAMDDELEAILGAERWEEIRSQLPPPPKGPRGEKCDDNGASERPPPRSGEEA